MFTLLKTLHVLLAIFLIGPLAMIPMTALRSIRRRDAGALHGAARQTMVYGLGSVLVFLLGFGLVEVRPQRFSMADPWISISMALYVVALVLVLALLVPGLRRAGKLIEQGVPGTEQLRAATPATPVESGTSGSGGTDGGTPATATEPTLTATAAELAGKQKLDSLYGRTAAVAGLVALLFLVIIVMMVAQPFS